MDTEGIAKTTIGRFFIKALVAGMESRFRYRFFSPLPILNGAGLLPGQRVLEVGCGTGYFTIPAARLIGGQGSLVALDILAESVALVSQKVQAAGLKNVHVINGDALNTGLAAESFQVVLLFGVIPAPMLPLARLLPEVHRLVIAGGSLAVWPPIPGWLPRAINESELFALSSKQNSVFTFLRCSRGGV